MRAPTPTAREVRWAFYVVAICALALTAAIVWGIVHKVNESDSVLHVAVANADQVQRLSEQLDTQDAKLDALKAQAAGNAKAARIAVRQNRRLLAYLKANGIEIPKTLTSSGPRRSAPKASATHQGASPAPSSPAGPGTTATPTPTAGPTTTGLDPVCALLNLPTCPLLP